MASTRDRRKHAARGVELLKSGRCRCNHKWCVATRSNVAHVGPRTTLRRLQLQQYGERRNCHENESMRLKHLHPTNCRSRRPGQGGWETWSGVLSNGQVSNHPFLGTGAEPTGIGQFKAYGLFFEDNYSGVANLNLHVKGSNCSGSDLASDIGYDVKMMARLGSSASGQQLCVQRSGASVPSGETRRLHQVAYYSGSTSMR